ncbi:MAG: hypothetical protein WC829_02890 [Hyphomicrobium sp.]|jgi:hypothetical protein
MKKILAALFLVLILAPPVFAGWDDPVLRAGADVTLEGTTTIAATHGSELLTLTCAGVGLSAPVGAWSCSGDTITRTASGSDLTLVIGPTVTAGNRYEGSVTYATITAGTFSLSIGGQAQVTHSAAGVFAEHFTSGATTAPTLTAVAASAGTITLSSLSMKLHTDKLTNPDAAIFVQQTLANATANEAGVVMVSNQTGAAGNKTTLQLHNNGTGSGTEYLLEGLKDGTRVVSFDSAGAAILSSSVSASGSIVSSRSATTTTGALQHTSGGFTIGAPSVGFGENSTLAAMNGSDQFIGFNFAPTNSNHTSTGNSVIGFNAANIMGDAEATEYGLLIGTGYDHPIIATPPSAQTIAAGNTVTADACGTMKQITAGGAVTTDTTNTFSAPAATNAGCCMDVVNVGAQNITLDNNALFFSPAAGDVVMTANDSIRVCSNGTAWYAVTALVAN